MDDFEDIFYGGDGEDDDLEDDSVEAEGDGVDGENPEDEESSQSDAGIDFNTRFSDLATGASQGTGTMEMVGTSRMARAVRSAEDNAIQKLYGVLSGGAYQKISETARLDIVDRFSNIPNVNLYHTETLVVTIQFILSGKKLADLPGYVNGRMKEGAKVTAFDVFRYYRKFGPVSKK